MEVDWARCSQSGWESLNYFSTMADLSWFSWSLSLYSFWEAEKVILVIRFPGVWCKWYKANLKWADYCFWKAITGMQQWFKGQTKPRKSSFLFSSSKIWVRFASQHQCIITPRENLQFLNWRLQPSLQWIMTSRKKVQILGHLFLFLDVGLCMAYYFVSGCNGAHKQNQHTTISRFKIASIPQVW